MTLRFGMAVAAFCTAMWGAGTEVRAVAWPRLTLGRAIPGFEQPTAIAHAGDASGRLFVGEQAGRIRAVRNGAPLAAPFLDIVSRVLSGGERGLLGIAFPPGYAAKKYFYVNYTRRPDGATVIARYRTTADPDRADAASEEIVLLVAQPFANHNGGQIAFGPDGLLYIGMGDGGSGGDPQGNGQNGGTLLGKMLRIDVESGATPYAVPATNPFVGRAGFRGEIWALGLRNPWRFSFDRQTGDLYVADVGQAAREEVNFRPAASPGGENYGWNVMEGTSCFLSPGCDAAGLTLPVAEYDHTLGCSVTGGYVYRGSGQPSLRGIYFYGDFCSGRVFGLAREGASWSSTVLATFPVGISTFGEDEAGELFLADHSGGVVYAVAGGNAPPQAPALVSPADNAAGLPGDVTFSWGASTDPEGSPVTYLFFLSTDPAFAGVTPVAVAGAVAPSGRGAGKPFPAEVIAAAGVLFLAGCAIAAFIRRTRGRRRFAAALVFSLAPAVLSAGIAGCGGGGGGGGPGGSPIVTHAVTDLSPGTVYFWKVAATDGIDENESPVRRFSTR